MSFNSLHFLLFFPTVVAVYYILPHRFRYLLLLISSYYFYMAWKPGYAILIAFSTIIDYVAAIQLDKQKLKNNRRKWLLLSIFVNLGLLFFFKYYNFFSKELNHLTAFFSLPFTLPKNNLLLPVGISFYTFQTLSYTIDVYRNVKKPEKHFGIFALYVSFFPQLVAGPIERATRLLSQFRKQIIFNYPDIKNGLKLILWGMFKKVVIADRLGFYANIVYNDIGSHTGPDYAFATLFFAFQIYCDFSGYSDIAIGSAKVLGINLMKNFNCPYFATSISDFWRRWHISLTTWFRDYLYIPLGGNRISTLRTNLNVLIVFILSGLWHGANWTFIIWGAFHGFLFLLSKLTERLRTKAKQILKLPHLLLTPFKVGLTFSLVYFSWIFFRANTLSDAIYILKNLKNGWSNVDINYANITLILFLLTVEFITLKDGVIETINKAPKFLRWSIYYLLIFGCLLFFRSENNEFIYFQF